MKTVEQIRKEYPDFKSPKELGITDKEYCALNEVREGLCEGRYIHTRHFHPNGFNMEHCYLTDGGCGTAACIGGWLFFRLDPEKGARFHEGFKAIKDQRPYDNLFYPNNLNWKMTPKDAAQAVANFMMGNKKGPWDFWGH